MHGMGVHNCLCTRPLPLVVEVLLLLWLPLGRLVWLRLLLFLLLLHLQQLALLIGLKSAAGTR